MDTSGLMKKYSLTQEEKRESEEGMTVPPLKIQCWLNSGVMLSA
jgi:hypothetical protein